MQHSNFTIILAATLLAVACSPTISKKGHTTLLDYFQPAATADTLVFEVDTEGGQAVAPGDTIPNALFFTVLDAALLSEINYVADSFTAVVLALKRFPLNPDVEACLVDIRQYWFQHQSLLLYDRREKAFTGRVTVAEWYGGDGGQILIGSWLVDYNGDGQKDLVRREIHHTLRPDENGEALDETHESALLLVWREGRFVEQPLSDTMLVVKQYPIRSLW